MTTAPIYYLNGSAFCARCNALMLRDYPNPLRFHHCHHCRLRVAITATRKVQP